MFSPYTVPARTTRSEAQQRVVLHYLLTSQEHGRTEVELPTSETRPPVPFPLQHKGFHLLLKESGDRTRDVTPCVGNRTEPKEGCREGGPRRPVGAGGRGGGCGRMGTGP